MDRLITKKLLLWKNQKSRKPMLLRGARQVGKTWSVIDFGKTFFKGNVHVIDLEQHLDWQRLFESDLVASRILSELEILINTRIVPGDDLLFFDEIQSCPRAIMALRYFYEELPKLHVIAAGSLLEFAMQDISFPVGRVQFLNMHPINFVEFLMATGKDKVAEVILSTPRKQPQSVHNLLLSELRKYLFIGGMPECVKLYANSNSIRDALEVNAGLINTFQQDFGKYAPYSDKRCLNTVLSSAAKNVGKQIKYSRLAEGYTNPTIKKAFNLLCHARVLQKIPSANPAGLPLGATASDRKFKALMLDLGLMHSLCGLPIDVEYNKPHLLDIYQGALAEQFVGQELLAAGQNDLFYWSRDARSSNAEVDYLTVLNGQIFPIEVKSGLSGRLKSLHLLLKTFPNCPSGYVISSAPYSELPEQKLIFLPLYYAYIVGSHN